MKKLLSVVLALAIVIGCLSMATFAGDGQWPAATDVTGLHLVSDLTDKNKTMSSSLKGITTDAYIEETVGGQTQRYILLQYKVYNLNTVKIKFTGYSFFNYGGWNTLLQTYPGNEEDSNAMEIPANSSRIFTMKIPVTADNKVTKSDGSATYAIGDGTNFRVRFDQKDNHSTDREFIIEALNEVSALFCKNAADTCYIFTATKLTGTASYNGVKLTVTQNTDANAGMIVFGTATDKQDGAVFEDCPGFTGALTVSYTFYNPNDTAVNVALRFTRRAYWGFNAGNNLSTSDITIPANSKAVITNSINVTNGKLTLDEQEINASDIRVRFNINYKNLTMGAVYYIETANTNDPMFYGTTSNNGFAKTLATEFPNLQVMATPEPTIEPTEEPTPVTSPVTTPETSAEPTPQAPVGIEFSVKADQENGSVGVNDYNRSPWASDATFTGQKKLNYVVYNTSNKDVTVELHITMMKDGRTWGGDAETIGKVTIDPGYKADLSAYVNVEDGTVKMKADDSLTGSLNLVRLRFTLAFDGGAKIGDSVIIAPADGNSEDFVMTQFAAGGVDKELVYEFPAEPTPPPKYIAAKFEQKEASDEDAGMCDWGKGQFLEDDATFNGTISHKYVIYNTGVSPLTATFYYNNKDGKGSNVEGSKKQVSVAPGAKENVEVYIAFTDGVATLNGSGDTAKLSTLRIRLDVKFNEAVKGNSFVIASATEDENDYLIKKQENSNFEKTLLTKEQLPVVKVATGVTLKTTEEADGSGKLYFVTTPEGGLCDATDVKNGKVTKSFKIKNNGPQGIEVKLDLQLKVDSSWKSPAGKECDWVVIEPGKTAVVTCSATCEDGKVKIGETEYAISKLFGKFSIKGEDGTLPENSSFTIYFAEDEASNFMKMVSKDMQEDGWSLTVVYSAAGAGTGDVLPVAIMATVALAFVTLVVVSKKRKED